MTFRYNYDNRRDPPAPVLPLRVGQPGGAADVALAGLVDTGADLSEVPAAIARQLGLPPVSEVAIRGVGGVMRMATVYAVLIETDWASLLTEVVGLGREALIGRDLLNRWGLTLHGPNRLMEVFEGRRGRAQR